MRKVELLPTQDSEAGYGPGDKTNVQIKIEENAWSSAAISRSAGRNSKGLWLRQVFIRKIFYSKVSLFQKVLYERVIIPKFGIMTLRNKKSFQNTDTSGWKSSE